MEGTFFRFKTRSLASKFLVAKSIQDFLLQFSQKKNPDDLIIRASVFGYCRLVKILRDTRRGNRIESVGIWLHRRLPVPCITRRHDIEATVQDSVPLHNLSRVRSHTAHY